MAVEVLDVRRALLLALFSALLPGLLPGWRIVSAQDEPADGSALLRRVAALSAGQKRQVRSLLREYLRRFPDAPEAPRAALDLALTYSEEKPGEAGFRLRALAEVYERYPDSEEGRRARRLRYAAVSGQDPGEHPFSDLPFLVGPTKSLGVTRNAPDGTSRYRIFRLNRKELSRLLVTTPFAGIGRLDLARRADSIGRRFVGDAEVRFRGSGEHRLPGDFSRPGVYVVEEEAFGVSTRHVVRVEGGTIQAKTLGNEVLVYAFDASSGDPLRGLDLMVRTEAGSKLLATGRDGIARFETSGECWIIGLGDEVIWCFAEAGKGDALPRALVHIATDRPVYRPGQAVFFRAILRESAGRRPVLPGEREVEVRVLDPRRRTVSTRSHRWSPLGTLEGSFQLAAEPPLGRYEVQVRERREDRNDWDLEDAGPFWSRDFHVLAYRKPEMSVTVEPAGTALVGRGRVRARIEARYFHGGAVVGAKVSWRAERLDAPGEERPRIWRTSWNEPRDRWKEHYDFQPTLESFDAAEVAEGESFTDARGGLRIEFDVERFARVAPVRITAVVTDESDRIAVGDSILTVAPAAYRLDLATPRLFYEPGETAPVRLRVIDHADRPVADEQVELTAFLNTFEPDADGEWESFWTAHVRTGPDGTVRAEIPLARSGGLRLRARAYDENGHRAQDRLDLRVAGDHAYPAPALDADEEGLRPGLRVLPQRIVYRPGETMRLMVHSDVVPLSCLLTIESDRFHEARVLRLVQRSTILELPVRAAYSPNVFVKLAGTSRRRPVSGGFEVFVEPPDVLDLTIETDKTVYAPRERGRVTVRASRAGAPVDSEVELAIVDEALFGVIEDDTPPLSPFFHPRADGWAARSFSSGTRLGDSWDSALRTDPFDSYPLFGGQAEESPDVRFDFPDTLYWSGSLRTGSGGVASVEIEMPDSLTRWRIIARGVAGAEGLGEARAKTRTRKRVVVRLAAPRFLTEGDEAVIGVLLHNGLEEDSDFGLSLEAEGGEVEGPERSFGLPSGGMRRFDWRVRVGEPGSLVLRARAEAASDAKSESDAVRLVLPVRPLSVEQTAVRSAVVTTVWQQSLELPMDAVPRGAVLEIGLASSLDAVVNQALPYLAGYPYGCTEQTMSRFLPAVVAARARERAGVAGRLEQDLPAMVELGLQRLYDFQHGDGGWGWWRHDETDRYMTAYVVHGLATARRTGFPVDQGVLADGLDSLGAMPATAFGNYVLSAAGRRPPRFEPRNDEERAWLVLAGRRDLTAQLPGTLPGGSGSRAVRATALAIRALAAIDPRDFRIPPLVERLLAMRRGAAWNSTLDSAWAVMALCDLPLREREVPATVRVNGMPLELSDGRAEIPMGSRARLEVINRSGEPLQATVVLRYRGIGGGKRKASAALRIESRLQRESGGNWHDLARGETVALHEPLRLRVTVISGEPERYLMVVAPFAAGLEARLDEAQRDEIEAGNVQLHDDRVEVARARLDPGTFPFTLPLYPTQAGTFGVPPARVFPMYEPDRAAYGEAGRIKVVGRG